MAYSLSGRRDACRGPVESAVARSLERQRESRINRQGMSPREERRSDATDKE